MNVKNMLKKEASHQRPNIILYYFVSVIILKRQNYEWRTDQYFPGVRVGEDVNTNGQPERVFWG